MSEILTKIIPSNLAHKSPFAVLSHESIHDHVIAAGMMERDRKFSVPDYICSTLSYVAQAPNYNVTRNYYVHPFISDLCIILVSEIIWRSEQCVRYIRNAKMYLQTSLIS